MPKTLLMADDSVTIQKVVGITFASEDVELVTVDNGDAALKRAREIKPDLVLADVSMPGLDGYELCAALKADPELSRIPVLLLTGTFERFDKERATRAKVDAYIAKPFEAQALVDQVHQLLERELPRVVEDLPAAKTSADPQAAPDFSFDDLEFEAGTKPAAASEESPVSPPSPAPGVNKTVATPLAKEAATALTLPEEVAVAVNTDDGETQREEISQLGDALFNEGAVLESLNRTASDETGPSGGSLKADPSSVDPADDLNASADSGSIDVDPQGQSEVLGEVLLPPARPPAPHPADKTVAWEPKKSPLIDPEPEKVEAELDWAEPASAQPEPMPAPDPLRDDLIEDPEPAALIADAEPLPAGPDVDAIREVLEKLAWEAFGPLSEQLVREIVQKVEAIAWEVVPQLAERLLQDEIKRMKAHSSD